MFEALKHIRNTGYGFEPQECLKTTFVGYSRSFPSMWFKVFKNFYLCIILLSNEF